MFLILFFLLYFKLYSTYIEYIGLFCVHFAFYTAHLLGAAVSASVCLVVLSDDLLGIVLFR